MVLEQLVEKKFVLQRFSFLFLLSLAYVFVGYGVQYFFFPGQSISTVLLVTILLLPSLHHVVGVEEKIERQGSDHWWKRHRTIIRCYSGAFCGLLMGFFLVGFLADGLTYQENQLETSDLRPEIVTMFTQTTHAPSGQDALALFSSNLQYLLIAFGLSLFYGAGAIFLVVFNTSFFAAFVHALFTNWQDVALQLTGISLLHLVPESLGFIFAAIGGAALSYALIHEKLTGKPLRNVLRNCAIFLGLGILFVLMAAFIEVYVTAATFSALI